MAVHQTKQEAAAAADDDDNQEMKHPLMTKNINNDTNIMTSFDDKIGDSEYPFMEENVSYTSTIQAPPLLQTIPTEYQWISPPAKTRKEKIKYCSLSADRWKQSSLKLVPKYNKLPDFLFKRLLFKNIPYHCYCEIQQWLKNLQFLQFIRQRAVLMCTIYQLIIERDYWIQVHNLGMPAMAWLSTIVKNVKQQNHINWDYPRTAKNVLHRQKIIENKLLQAESDLNAHLQQKLDRFCEQVQNKMSIDHIMNIISQSLSVWIRHDLHQLQTNYEHKQVLLKFDVNDVHLVKSFYDLNPTEEQIRSVQKIWRTKVKSCKRTISQMKNSSSMIVEQTTGEFYNDHDHQHGQLLSFIESLHHSMRVIVEDRLKNIEQRTQQIIKFIHESSV